MTMSCNSQSRNANVFTYIRMYRFVKGNKIIKALG